jgi:Rha family phage regulatory protein
MDKMILHPEYKLYERKGKPFCDSLQVAETFGKRHADVLRDIEKITAPTSGLTEGFSQRIFALSNYKIRGKQYPKYFLSKNGFSVLVMGYGGKRAMQFKEAFIVRYDLMEEFIQSLYAAKLEHPAFTEAVMLSHPEPKHYHFSNETNMIYRIVIGVDAKTFRQQRGLESGAVIRPYLANNEIRAIETLQRADIGLLAAGHDYAGRKVILENYYAKIQLRLVG